jgi:hypothetical protein
MRTAELLEDIKRHISVPTYQPRFSDTDVMEIANGAQRMEVCDMLSSLREEFFVVDESMTVPGTATSGSTYCSVQIPERAIGRTIRDIWLSTKSSTNLDDYKNLIKIELDEILEFRSSANSNGSYGFYYKDDRIYVQPPSTDDQYIILKYLQRPSEIVSEDQTADIVSFTHDTLTVLAVPDNIVAGTKIDITKVTAGFNVLLKDAVVASTSATTISVSGYSLANPLSGFSAGDVVSTARHTSVIQLPEDAHHVLLWAVCLDIESSIGVDRFIQIAQKRYDDVVRSCRNLCSPRAENSRPKIVNQRGLLRSNLGARKFPTVTA